MVALRRLLMYLSALAALIIFIGWILFNRRFDIMPFGLIALFLSNAFYLYFSRPTVQTSDILDRASSRLSLVSLELRYLSQEAQIREAEAEKLRLAKIEKENYKLQVAKDLLQHLQSNISSRRGSAVELRQIASRQRIGTEVLAQFTVVPEGAKTERLTTGAPAAVKAPEPAAPTNLLPAAPPSNASKEKGYGELNGPGETSPRRPVDLDRTAASA